MRDDAVLRHALPLGRGLGRNLDARAQRTTLVCARFRIHTIKSVLLFMDTVVSENVAELGQR